MRKTITQWSVILIIAAILDVILLTCYCYWSWFFRDFTAMQTDVREIKNTLDQYHFTIKH